MSTGDDEVTVVRSGSAPPDLSILMPLYRREATVGPAVASVLAQRDVVAEVVISDDHSGDATLDRALDVVNTWQGPHRVVLRRGARRLWRDHWPALVDLASCDVVMQAHDDDISHPARARTMLDIMARTGAVLVGSEADIIDECGALIEESPTTAIGDCRLLTVEEVLTHPRTLIGSRLAWRRSALAPFGRWDTSVSAVAPDRVLSLRGALAGKVAVAYGPLLANRVHRGSWSHALADERSTAAYNFGFAAIRLSLLRVADRDLDRACELGWVGEADERRIRSLLDGNRDTALEQALDAHDELVSAGRLPLWVDKEELALANQGDLVRQLQARAARTRALVGPAGAALRMARAGRRRVRGRRRI